MFREILKRTFVCALVVVAGIGSAHAAGALAVGTCGAYGTAYDFDRMGDARDEAMNHCTAMTIRQQCAAFAIERRRECGARGWAHAPTREEAENIAVRYCESYGRHRCKVRAWVCDERG